MHRRPLTFWAMVVGSKLCYHTVLSSRRELPLLAAPQTEVTDQIACLYYIFRFRPQNSTGIFYLRLSA
jgi:hypothetical protein